MAEQALSIYEKSAAEGRASAARNGTANRVLSPAPRTSALETGARSISPAPGWKFLRTVRCSTSRYGIGQQEGSNRTPLGLHRIAEKIGGGWPIGSVFKSRTRIGFTWKGLPHATITNRILWLEGLEPGFNRGGDMDSHRRYIYIHGTGDEPTLGRPASCGCIHLSAADLIPLFDHLPTGTLVWISEW